MNYKLKALAGLVAGLLLVSSGAAWAAWTKSENSNNGRGAARSMAFDVAASVPTGDLYPGGQGDLKFAVTNTNPFPIKVTSVALQSAVTPLAANAACATTGGAALVTANPVVLAAPSNETIAPTGTVVYTLDNALTLDVNANDSCQGATFQVPVTVTAAQVTPAP